MQLKHINIYSAGQVLTAPHISQESNSLVCVSEFRLVRKHACLVLLMGRFQHFRLWLRGLMESCAVLCFTFINASTCSAHTICSLILDTVTVMKNNVHGSCWFVGKLPKGFYYFVCKVVTKKKKKKEYFIEALLQIYHRHNISKRTAWTTINHTLQYISRTKHSCSGDKSDSLNKTIQ